MTKKFVHLLAAMSVIATTGTLLAQKTGEGRLTVKEKDYSFGHAIAYELKTEDDEGATIAVVLTGQAVSGEKLREVRASEKEGNSGSFNRPYLRLEFKKTGELRGWSAGAGSTSLSHSGGKATGDLKVENGRAIGKASQPNETEGMFPSGFDVRFGTTLLKDGDSLPDKKHGPAANIQPTVSGTFKGNGKDAKLAYVSARWGEPFADKPGIVLIFTEKDHSKARKPEFDANFGKFGSALIISLHENGDIYGCQVVHTAHKRQGFTSLGRIQTSDFDYADGKVTGGLATDGELDVFGETWQADLKFAAPLGEAPPEAVPAKANKTANATKAKDADEDDDDDETSPIVPTISKSTGKGPTQPAADQLKVKELALTKDASSVEYKSLVQHIAFKSAAPVKSVCSELAANLKAQGWANDGSDMVNPQSSILKRKRGAATLTIFVKPEGGGSEVKMFTQGLNWDEQ